MITFQKFKFIFFCTFYLAGIRFIGDSNSFASERSRPSLEALPDDLVSAMILPNLNLRESLSLGSSSSGFQRCYQTYAPQKIKSLLRIEEPDSINYQPVCKLIYERVIRSLHHRSVNKLVPGSALKQEIKTVKSYGGGIADYGLAGTVGLLNELFLLPVEFLASPWIIKNYLEEQKYRKVLLMINKAYQNDLEYFEHLKIKLVAKTEDNIISKLSAADLAKTVRIADRLKLFCPQVYVERFDDRFYLGFLIDYKSIPTIAQVRKNFLTYIYQVADFLDNPINHPKVIKKII